MCPPCLPDYQAYMRGVDRGDQLVGYYNLGRRSKKWWKRVLYYIIEVAALNAYVLDKHAHTGRDSRDYLAFRIALAEELVGSFSGRRRIGPPRSLESQRLERLDTSLGHWPEVVQEKQECVVCSSYIVLHSIYHALLSVHTHMHVGGLGEGCLLLLCL